MTVSNRDLQILRKIVGYCEDIEFTHAEYEHNQVTFRENPTYRNAIALCLLQIGELVKNLSSEFTDSHTNIPWKAIRGMRNVVAHEYGHIDLEVMWETSDAEIMELRIFCTEQLQINDQQMSFPDLTM